MEGKDCDLPVATKIAAGLVFGFLILYFFKEAFEYQSWKCFFEKQGSIIGAVIGALVLTLTVAYTIKKQSEHTRIQVESSRKEIKSKELLLNIERATCLFSSLEAILFRVGRIDKKTADYRDKFEDLYVASIERADRLLTVCGRIDEFSPDLYESYRTSFRCFLMAKAVDIEEMQLEECQKEMSEVKKDKILSQTKKVITVFLEKSKNPKELSEGVMVLNEHTRELNHASSNRLDEIWLNVKNGL